MKMSFVSPVLPASVTKRPIIRLKVQRAKSQTHDGVDSYLRTEMRVDAYFNQNLEFLDRGYDHDEFGDIDNEYEGLTITEPMSEVELFQFCTGCDII
jgi:hypothetical protein